ncbi:CoA pyrophosphatase [Acidimicrobiia bacterium EGI L10123]|uniref:NUDIX hydrolase n=1 Tax=Salinilacustrithrix flava TaxID=2957203 RepID=UPI003D7C143D|nr:CoA pyrophosphatase [Acidimicrobiia bacterium EGI L10123]
MSRGGPQRIPRPPGTRPGGPPSWASLPEDHRHPSLDQVRAALAAGPEARRSPVEGLTSRCSAVLAPLYEHDGETHVVLTRRAWHMRSHTGEVSFPGGKQEPGETPWQTALREAHEEVALDPASVEQVGELHHLATVTSRSSIVPYVGVLPGRPRLAPNPDEVDAILHVSLADLLDPEAYRQERWGLPGIDRPIHFFEIVGDTIWGATASMLVDLLNRITTPTPTS